MTPLHWEVEQKFALTAPAEIRGRFAAMGVEFGPVVEQVDHYFNHPAHDFAVSDEALRVRQVGATNYMTYKGPRIDSFTKTRSEIELPLPEGEHVAGDFAALFFALGFRSAGQVHKRRQNATLHWNGHQVDVALDNVVGLGSYLELEILADDKTLEDAKKALQSLARNLDLDTCERQSYLEMLMRNNS